MASRVKEQEQLERECDSMRGELEKQLSLKEEKDRLSSFLRRGFCVEGRIVLIKAFRYAIDQGKSFGDIMLCFEAEYHRVWKGQHIYIRGNPDADSVAGTQTKVSIENIYKELKIPPPPVAIR